MQDEIGDCLFPKHIIQSWEETDCSASEGVDHSNKNDGIHII
jgi:hypothetical protein